MGDHTKIQWTEATWNPFRGTAGKWHCVHISPGCQNCYAETLNQRFGGPKYRVGADSSRLDAEVLAQPLRWRRPRLVFPCSMTDLFLEEHTNEQIAAVFGVMAACPQHTFQVLTKRAERMREWFDKLSGESWHVVQECAQVASERMQRSDVGPRGALNITYNRAGDVAWPLPNCWLGVSCEDQQRADERIPELLQCPAIVRWVSAEPLIAPIDFRAVEMPDGDSLADSLFNHGEGGGLDWVVIGGESGPKARPCALEWIGSIVDQCKTAGVACFVKQLGACVVSEARTVDDPDTQRLMGLSSRWAWGMGLRHPKGGDPSEWPEDLRVREWPMTGQGDAP